MPAAPVVPVVLPEVMPLPGAWAPPGVEAVEPALDPPEVMEPVEPSEPEAPLVPLLDPEVVRPELVP
ncbi:MAG TPA: hypothetical protein VHK68_07910, partial [Gemmatimonadales bacterium]|nr:hypothetical protein [Gemmatimonadales bacterium]